MISAAMLFAAGCYAAVHVFSKWNTIEEKHIDSDAGREFSIESGASYDLEANLVPPEPVTVGSGPLHPTVRPVTSSAPNLDLVFEELEIGARLARGGFGEVHRGLWKGIPVAVKMFVPPPAGRRDLEDQLASEVRAEATILAAVQHPNVCRFMGACMAPPNRVLVMELVSPGSLWEALRKDSIPSVYLNTDYTTPTGFWPWPVIMKVAVGIARGMSYLHGHAPYPIVHRDLKSANVLVDQSYNAKICDFGLATFIEDEGRGVTGDVGTAKWMAPEVIANVAYGGAVDVYSFGIVCWELVTREVPYKDLSQRQATYEVLFDRRRPAIPQWCPNHFANLMEMTWRHEADQRPSFREIIEFLQNMPDPTRASDTNV